MKIYIFLLGLFFSVFSIRANIIHVPGDSLITIQTAIDSSETGDTVLVQPGTYPENITISKNIVLGSLFLTTGDANYIFSTIIDPPGSVVVVFGGGRDSTCILTGFTITGGNSSGYGGAIRCVNTSPIISHNIIRDNTVNGGMPSWGGGIFLEVNSNPKIIYNQILNNTATYSTTQGWGGGIYSKNSNPFIAHNTISGNSADVNGGGIYFLNSQVRVYNNTIKANSSQYGGGIYCDGNSSGIISGNTIHTDSAWYGGGIYLNANTDVDIIKNIIHSNYASGNTAGLHNGSSLSTIDNNTFCFNQSLTIPALNSIGTDTVYNNIFYRNLGTGAVFTGHLKNCDFWGNT
ncbi:MAG: right-handed parallel beta-helix repeat-containing protein, partial [Calditrichota bacterium]